MSLAKVYSRAQLGIEAPLVTVEVHLSGGLPAFSLVGLPEAAVRESRERVRSALLNAGFDFPQRRITVNLAPADLPKEGGRYDLAIAIGILLASSQLQAPGIADHEFIAELALGGELRAVPGVLPAAIACQKAARKLVTSQESCYQAGFVEGLERFTGDSLLAICQLLGGEAAQAFTSHPEPRSCKPRVNLSEVRGQQLAKRALEIAAAGGHNLLMSGNPGSGKSMLAARLPGLLPELTTAQALETAAIHSVAGLDMNAVFQGQRPFRAPHHSSSAVALVGGGSIPSDISIACMY